MRLLEHVAQRIIDEVTKVIEEEVIVINRDGYIIAASDTSRIGSFHEGGMEVIRTKQKLIISKEELNRFRGVKIGLNLPIRFQQQVIGVIGITGSKQETTRHGELIQRMTELIIEEAYARETLDSEMRGLETFVSEWLHSVTMSADWIERGELLGMNMTVPRYCVLVQLEDEAIAANVELDIFRFIQSIFSPEHDHVIVRAGKGRIILLYATSNKRSDEQLHSMFTALMNRIEKQFRVEVKIGSSRMHLPHEMHDAYNEAKRALAITDKDEKVVVYGSFPLELALHEIAQPTKQSIVSKVLGNVLDSDELLLTLETYFERDLSLKETAKALHIHINTLHYRLKRIHALTGFDVRKMKDLVTLYLAYTFYKQSKFR